MSKSVVPDLKYWLGFNLVKGIGPAKLRILIDRYGTVASAWHVNEADLVHAGFDSRTIGEFVKTRSFIDLDHELQKVQDAGIKLIVWDSEDYPKYLKEITHPPPLIYVRGEVSELDNWAIAVVGTRRKTSYGRQVTTDLVRGLVRNQVTVVSGLARGIDSIAHQTAVEMGGRTIAVLGSGLDIIYPSENRSLANTIVSGHGALISEFALGTKPEAKNFPPRNRVISGLSLGVIVVEAGKRSGALITADFALEQDREVFAVPGNVTSPASRGTNTLIQEGAKLVRNVEDVLEELNMMMVQEKTAVQMVMPESAEEARLLSNLTHQPVHIDELTRQVELPSALVSSTLTLMELKGMVRQVGGMQYVLAREPDPVYDTETGSQ
ncbi:MAG TPA: DNA-processing protein DprA [candidate division Zixibacteria bacterium]|nr:DNA-processing protein DprA [candidate division Zixibacteria bacterium]